MRSVDLTVITFCTYLISIMHKYSVLSNVIISEQNKCIVDKYTCVDLVILYILLYCHIVKKNIMPLVKTFEIRLMSLLKVYDMVNDFLYNA